MKIMDQPDGLEGYVVLVEEDDLKKPLNLPELKGDWVDIINRCEGVVRNDGLFHCFYLTNNEFGLDIYPQATECRVGVLRGRGFVSN